MKKVFSLLFIVVLLISKSSFVFSQQTILSGTVTDTKTGQPILGVSVTIKGKTTSAITSEEGRFVLSSSEQPPFSIEISHLGYANFEQEVSASDRNISIQLEQQSVLGQEVIIAASRVPERILESPVSIERFGATAVRETASPTFYDALANLKGVEVSTQSFTFKSVNTRGFNANGNFRFNQLVDGMDNSVSRIKASASLLQHKILLI